jgi:hypothetical protein
MVKKLCIKIGQFIIYCLKLCEHEEENKMEITPNLINEWLYGGANNE